MHISPSINEAASTAMLSMSSKQEIRRFIFSMHGDKSPSPDGMIRRFARPFAVLLGLQCLCDTTFFNGGCISHAVNHTFIALVPKRDGANRG